MNKFIKAFIIGGIMGVIGSFIIEPYVTGPIEKKVEDSTEGLSK